MSSTVLVVFFALMAGLAVQVQSPLSSMLAQLSFSVVVDHFGLPGTSVRPLEPARRLGWRCCCWECGGNPLTG